MLQLQLQPQVLPRQLLKPSNRPKAEPYKLLRNNKLHNKNSFLINLLTRRSKDNRKSSKTKNLKRRLPMPRKRDRPKKFFQSKELKNSRNFKKKKLPKNLKLKEWSRNSCLHRLFKRPRLLLPRRLLPRPTLPDWRGSMSSQEERLRPNCKCLRLNNKWKLNKLWIWKR